MPSRLEILWVAFMLVGVTSSLFSLIVTLTHWKPTAAPEKEVVFQCEAGWPSSKSQELSPWEIQTMKEYNQTDSLAQRELIDTVYFNWPRDISHVEKSAPDKYTAEDLSNAQTQEPLSDDVKPSTGWAFTIGAQPSSNPPVLPTMATYITRPNCCWMSFACYSFFLEHNNESTKFLSLEWRKGLCCYRQMVNNPNCTNPPQPPDLKPMYIAPPPYCMN